LEPQPLGFVRQETVSGVTSEKAKGCLGAKLLASAFRQLSALEANAICSNEYQDTLALEAHCNR
jgi:hypothetical protein